jgi:DNA repair photolyase
VGDKSKIEWTDATWNPIRGCTRVSEGCRNCYAEAVAARFSGPGQGYEGLAIMGQNGPRWTGKVAFVKEHLADPLRWKRPRRIFVGRQKIRIVQGFRVSRQNESYPHWKTGRRVRRPAARWPRMERISGANMKWAIVIVVIALLFALARRRRTGY